MKKQYQLRLLVIITLTFIVTFIITYFIQSDYSLKQAQIMSEYTLQDARDVVNQLLENQKELLRSRGTDMVTRVQSIALFLEKNPQHIKNQELLAELARINKVDQLTIIGKDLNVVAMHPETKNKILLENTGFKKIELKEAKTIAVRAIQNQKLSIYQDINKGVFSEKPMQISVASFQSIPGGVIIGNSGHYSQKSIETLTNTSQLTKSYRFAKWGQILITDTNAKIICSSNANILGNSFIEKYGQQKWDDITIGLKKAEQALAEGKIKLREGFYYNSMPFVQKNLYNEYVQYIFLPYERKKIPHLYLEQNGKEYNDESSNPSIIDWYIISTSIPFQEIHMSRNKILSHFTLLYLVLFFVTFIVTSRLTQRLVINGIYNINASLKKIAGGNLDERINVKSSPEFVMLSDGINSMVNSIKELSGKQLQQAVKNREFNMASQIQLAAMPNVFPAYPERKDFDIYAVMQTAESVGGDLYDFALLDSNHLGFTIADVSGKGFPAALFMMKAKVYCRMLVTGGLSIDKVMNRANNYLSQSNGIGMFLTKFIATLELSTGILSYINAAHPSPIIISQKNGTVRRLDPEKNNHFMLGLIKNTVYSINTVQLEKGDRILMYTDGVTEAENPQHELYGIDRFMNLLMEDLENRMSPQDLLEYIINAIRKFEEGIPPMDDITLLLVDYNGPDNSNIQKVSS